MKKAYFLILLAFAMVSFSGCKVENSNVENDSAARGMLEGWQQGMRDMKDQCLSSVFHFNAWYAAPDSLRDEIEDQYFPFQRIRQVGENSWAIMFGQNQQLVIETNGKTLASDAHWTVTLNCNEPSFGGVYVDESFSEAGLQVEIETVRPYTWNITVNSQESSEEFGAYEPYAQLTLGFVDTTGFNGMVPADLKEPFTLIGQGRFKFRNEDYWIEDEPTTDSDFTYLDFLINETLMNDTKYGSFAYWSQGVMTLRAFNAAGAERKVKVTFSKNRDDYSIDLEGLF